MTSTTAIAVVLLRCSAGAQQADRAQTEALARRAADRLSRLQDEADRLASEERTLLGDLRRLEIEREISAEELGQAERETVQVTADLSALDTQLAALVREEQTEAPRLRARLVSLYKLGQGRYVRLLLSTAEVQHIGQASRMVAVLARQDQNRVAIHQRRLEALSRSRTTLEERRQRLATLRADASRAKSAAAQAILARSALIRDIDQRRDLNAQFSGELYSAQQQLQATLSRLAGGASTTPPSRLPIAPFRGDLPWPVAGSVRQAFGRSLGGAAASNGMDIAAAEGMAVQAVHDGRVAFAGTFAGFGQLVIVDHGGQTFSLYGNLRDITVAQGSAIVSGDPIGTVGVAAAGAVGLYFELRIDGRPVDPVQWLRPR